MADFEDSLHSALDYESEVAYIALTSPLREDTHSPSGSQDSNEFDFSTEADLVDSPLPTAPVQVEVEVKQEEVEVKQEEVEVKQEEVEVKQEDMEAKPNLGRVRPPLMSKLGSARSILPGTAQGHGEEQTRTAQEAELTGQKPVQSKAAQGAPPPSPRPPVSPLAIPVPDYMVEMELPRTPTTKLHLIKEAQIPPSPKPRPKLEQKQHLYCTLVTYGSSGCGRSHLVDKLVLSNPSIFAKVVPTTTRRKRSSEVSGVDFNYLSHKEMGLGMARGDFIEYIKVHRRRGVGRKGGSELRKNTITQQASLQNTSSAQLKESIPTDTSTPSLPSSDNTEPLEEGERKYGSHFDLTEEDSPLIGGEMFGTSYQSLTAAIQQGKPCILLNVSTRGAQQLKMSGIRASYVLLHSDHTANGTPKSRHTSKIREKGADVHTPKDDVKLEPDYTISCSSLDKAYSDLHHYALQLVSELQLPSTSYYKVAQYEWEALPTVQFEHSQSVPHQKLVELTFSELLAYFHTANLKSQIHRAKAERSKSALFSLSKLNKRLQSEKLLVQAIVYCQLNEKERLHLRMLQTIYSKLTGNSLTCRRFGSHWQEIGFTGIDPADDLQEVGLLGLTQLIYFLENSRTAHFCKEIFQYCHRDTHVIPFVVMSFGFSQLALEALDGGALNKLCNKRDQIFILINEFYMAAFHHYYQIWKSSQKSILQLGLLMQQCGDYCKAHPWQVMQEFDKHLSIREPQHQLIPALLPKMENAFTPFNNITTSS